MELNGVRFLENLQLVLSESRTNSTYKYALLIALADICIEAAAVDDRSELVIPIERIAGRLKEMPLWRLQRLRTRTLDFLYPEDRQADVITLRPGVAACFRRFHALVVRLVHNLVVADRKCNGAKSDVLAGDQHRRRWLSHTEAHDSIFSSIGVDIGLPADREAAVHVADWCYSEARRLGAEVWITGNRYELLTQ